MTEESFCRFIRGNAETMADNYIKAGVAREGAIECIEEFFDSFGEQFEKYREMALIAFHNRWIKMGGLRKPRVDGFCVH